jgi:hypothetical protein
MEIESEKPLSKETKVYSNNRGGFLSKKPRGLNRIQYEAEVDAIKKQIGDLESIRMKLGLSARKMTQILLVDPSAWNRWTTRKTPPPPHIYRALQWYLALQEKNEGFTPQFFLSTQVFSRKESQNELLTQLKKLETRHQSDADRMKELEIRIEKHKHWIQVLILCIFVLLITQIVLK